jgi:integrase/recombinase XerD
VRLDNAVTLFLAEWPAEGVSPKTVQSYGKNLEWLVAFATKRGATTLEDLTPSLVRAAALSKMGKDKPRTANFKGGEAAAAQLVAATRKLAGWLVAEGLSVADLSVVKPPRVPERVQPRLLPGEFETLQAAILRRLISGGRHVPRVAVARDLALLNLLAETGLRAAEVCGLELDHVDLRRGEVLVVRAKRRRERVLSLLGTDEDDDPYRVVRLIDDWIGARAQLKHAAEHRSLWMSLKGNPLTDDELRNVLAKICAEAGLAGNRPPHAFRRYVFTEHYRQRPSSLPRLSARMGWSPNSHKMQGVYTRGAELDLSREPMPLLNGPRESDGHNVRSFERPSLPILKSVGSQGSIDNEPALAARGRTDEERARTSNSRKSRRFSR